MPCIHDDTERDVAASADGYCPLCQLDTIKGLRAMITELASDLATELTIRYHGTLNYPSERRRFERDMDVVARARALLKS